MRLIVIVIISVIIFLIGLGLGISIPLSTNPQQSYIGIIGIAISAIGAVFSGLNLWRLLKRNTIRIRYNNKR